MKKTFWNNFFCLFTILLASCNSEPKTYKITWLDWDNTVLKVDRVKEGEIPIFNGVVKHHVFQNEIYYFNEEWNTEILPAFNDATYKASFIANTDIFAISDSNLPGLTVSTTTINNKQTVDYIDDGVLYLPSTYNGKNITCLGGLLCDDTITEIHFSSTINNYGFDNSGIYNARNIKKMVFDGDNPAFSFTGSELLADYGKTLVTYFGFESSTYFMPNNIEKVLDGAFDNCAQLESVDTSFNSFFSSFDGILTNKNQTELIYCPLAKGGSIVFPNTLIKFGKMCFFQNCMNIESVIINEGFQMLYGHTFYNCTNLSFVSLPNTIKYLFFSEFGRCEKLFSITFVGTMVEWNAIYKDDDWNRDSNIREIICLDGSIAI